MEKYDSRVDAYIAKSAPFAKLILEYLRQFVHETSPLLNETMKWGFPFFDYKGPVCQMAAFKQHCGFGFWKFALLNDPNGVVREEQGTAGSFGKITQIADLPSKEILADFIYQAININEADKTNPIKKEVLPKVPKADIKMPVGFAGLLAANPKAHEVYEKFSPSHKREYLEWITNAKSEATRQKRLEIAVGWIAESKSRHWKYQ